GRCQSFCVMRRPSGRNHQTSGNPEPFSSCPVRNFVRRKIGCSRRSVISRCVNSISSRSASSHRNHEISLSWHHALLLPCCERPTSSPPRSTGTPCERNNG